MIGNLIGAFVAILIGVSLMPTISRQVQQIDTTNMPQYGATILKWVPGLFALGIIGIGIATAYSSLKNTFWGEDYDNSQQKQKEVKPLSKLTSGDTKWGSNSNQTNSGITITQGDTKLQFERSASLPVDNHSADFKSEIKVENHGEDYFK